MAKKVKEIMPLNKVGKQYPAMNRRRSGIFIFNLEPISNLVLVFLWLTLNQQLNVDKKTGFLSTLNFPASQRQTYVTKKKPCLHLPDAALNFQIIACTRFCVKRK